MTDPLPIEVPQPRTGIRRRLLALIVLLILLAPASLLARRAASKMDFFHLRSVTVEGTRYLDPDTVVARLQLDTLRSVWDDTGPLVATLKLMSQVSDVHISRKLPGTLVVSILENVPVALSPSPRGLEAVDSAGVVLPIDPTRDDLDLPIAAQRDRSILTLLGDARAGNPVLYQRISEISRDGKDGLVLTLAPGGEAQSGASLLRVRAMPGVSVSRLADIFPVESDLMRRRVSVAELDLRYRDQVIARLQ